MKDDSDSEDDDEEADKKGIKAMDNVNFKKIMRRSVLQRQLQTWILASFPIMSD